MSFLECTEGNLVFDPKWGQNAPSAADESAILDAVLKHREALLLEWERKVCTSN